MPEERTGSNQSVFSAAFSQARSGGAFGSGVRAQVFEVIVRQAIAGAPWREICAGPLQVNNISEREIEAEVRKRRGMGDDDGFQPSPVPKKPKFPNRETEISLDPPPSDD